MHHEFTVLTPEKVAVDYRLGSLGSRVSAHLIDLAILVAVLMATTMLLSQTIGRLDEGVLQLVVGLAYTFGILAYFVLLEGLWNGQTLGKKALGIRVRMADGTPVTFASALFRNLLRPADFLPSFYLVALACMFLNEKAQRIGDLGSGTIVTHERRALPRFTPAPHKFGIHPFEDHVGEIRGMTSEEYFAIKRLCDRFPELSPQVQQRMLEQVWEPFALRRSVQPIANVHPVYLMEAVVMRYARTHGML